VREPVTAIHATPVNAITAESIEAPCVAPEADVNIFPEPVGGAMAGAAATGAAAVADSFQSEPRRQIPTRSPPHHSEKETIYVGNLFFDVTSADLTKEFEKFGEVKAAKVVTDSRGLSKGSV
jgi:hypothetical protein